MSVDNNRPNKGLQSALRRLMPVVWFAALIQCGCAPSLLQRTARLSPRSTHSAQITRISMAADEEQQPEEQRIPRVRESAPAAAMPNAVRKEKEDDRPVSGHSILPGTPAESISRAEGRRRSGNSSRPALPASTAAEPGMLDRFRALYAPRTESSQGAEVAPRTDDAAERLRRQMLRWSDPFGLLKERETVGGGASAELEKSTSVAPEASEMPATVRPLTSLDAVIEALEQELRDWPGAAGGRPERLEEWRRRQTDLRLLYGVAGRSADAARVIEGLPQEEQEFWQSLMLAMNQYRASGTESDRAAQLTETLAQLRAATRHLQPLSRLEIYRLQFCTRIDGFGNAAAFPTSDFEPGQRLLLYAGVRNFRSELTAEGRYRSEFAAIVEFLREEDGEVLERIRLPQIPDECDEERTDYFQSFELTAPVLEGNYIVRLHLRDQLTRQTTEARLRMTIR
ncbi:MAG: hypothetical protein ACKO2L_19770 [Planctomycetaceae bacterium]